MYLILNSQYEVMNKDNCLPTEFMLFKFGINRAHKMETGDSEIYFDQRMAQHIYDKFMDNRPVDIVIDYEHQSVNGMQEIKPGAGWIKGLSIKEDGLYATNVEWTPRASQMLKDKEYRYMSPAIVMALPEDVDDEDYDEDDVEITDLVSVALTNIPALKNIKPLMNTFNSLNNIKKDKQMSDEKREKEILALTAATKAAEERNKELEAQLRASNKVIEEIQADQMIEGALREGRLTPSRKEEMKAFAKQYGIDGLKTCLSLMPVHVLADKKEELKQPHIEAHDAGNKVQTYSKQFRLISQAAGLTPEKMKEKISKFDETVNNSKWFQGYGYRHGGKE